MKKEFVQRMHLLCDELPYITSWYAKDMRTGQVYARDGSRVYPSASTRKTSILMAVLRAAHQGRLDLREPLRYEEHHRAGVVSGTFRFLTPGITITLRDALVQMIIISDNTCARMVLERIDLDEINDFCSSIGMKDTVHRTVVPRPDMAADHALNEVTTITACDQGLLYDLMVQACGDDSKARALGCSSAHCAFAVEVLSWQKLRNKISSLLPPEAKAATKGGTGRRGRMDGGVVFRYGGPLFVLTVYTDQLPAEMPDGLPGQVSAFRTMGLLGRACWEGCGAP